MHQYSLDRKVREKVLYIIVILSVALSPALKNLFAGLIEAISNVINQSKGLSLFANEIKDAELLPNIIGVPVIYGLLSLLFDRFLWKIKPINEILGVPNLGGKWTGKLQSSYDGEYYDMTLEIKQTWTKIQCKSSFSNSSSNSIIAALYTNDPRGLVLYFSFQNQSHDLETKNQQYDGFNILSLSSDKKFLSGNYFNNRPNPKKSIKGGNMGNIELKKSIDLS